MDLLKPFLWPYSYLRSNNVFYDGHLREGTGAPIGPLEFTKSSTTIVVLMLLFPRTKAVERAFDIIEPVPR